MDSFFMHIKQITTRVLIIFMIAGLIYTGVPLAGYLPESFSYAAGLSGSVKQGDTIELKSGDWSEEYLVLDPDREISGKSSALLILKNAKELVQFDSSGTSNIWSSSEAREWCSDYYDSLPIALQEQIIGTVTSEAQSDTGDFGAVDLNGEKVFFLSASEYDAVKDLSEIKAESAWWLRSPYIRNNSIAAAVNKEGKLGAAKVESDALARPAFDLSLPEDACIHMSTIDGEITWIVDLDNTDHSYGTAIYTWKDGNSVCEAKVICSYCGKTISETANALSEKDGAITTFTAGFSDTHFETQTSSRDESSFGSGDILKLKSGDWTEDYIILNPTRCNTRAKGMLLLLRDYSGNKTKFNQGIDENGENDDLSCENIWEGSLAQSWCTGYYRNLPKAVRDSIIGVRTTETESGYRWHEINNIDGTRGGDDADKDKVFFLSSREYISCRYIANIYAHDKAQYGDGSKWLLRAPGTDCSQDLKVYVGVVDNDGTSRNYGAGYFEYGARPAFNLNLEGDVCAVKGSEDGFVTWTVDLEDAGHAPAAPVYEWAKDGSSCTARAKCEKCGRLIAEESSKAEVTLIKEATETAEGEEKHTAAFSNDLFEQQSISVKTAKKSAGEETTTEPGTENEPPATGGDNTGEAQDQKESGQGDESKQGAPEENAEPEGSSNPPAEGEGDSGTNKDASAEAGQDNGANAHNETGTETGPDIKIPVKAGNKYTVSGSRYKVLSVKLKTAALIKAKNAKNVSVPSKVRINGKKYKVVQIDAKAFRGKRIRKVIVGKNVRVIKRNAFAGSKVKTVVLRTRLLKKSRVKGCMKSSRVKVVQIRVGKAKQNKIYITRYRKFLTKKITGRKVRLK